MRARMKLLALETATRRCTVSLQVHDRIWVADVDAGITHSQLVLPQALALLAQAGLRPNDLDAIAYGAGPGAFTGVRIACACAQGLALAHGLPVVPFGTLDALAYTCAIQRGMTPATRRDIWVINDARMNEVYCAGFSWQGETLVPVVPARVLKADAGLLGNPERWQFAGDAFLTLAAFSVLAPSVTTYAADGHGIARAAAAAWAGHKAIHPRDAQPLYVRDKVALTERERGITPGVAR
jgi:tRNA threonylcarbamoyladenosine biosynthesis protein TsaB